MSDDEQTETVRQAEAKQRAREIAHLSRIRLDLAGEQAMYARDFAIACRAIELRMEQLESDVHRSMVDDDLQREDFLASNSLHPWSISTAMGATNSIMSTPALFDTQRYFRLNALFPIDEDLAPRINRWLEGGDVRRVLTVDAYSYRCMHCSFNQYGEDTDRRGQMISEASLCQHMNSRAHAKVIEEHAEHNAEGRPDDDAAQRPAHDAA